MAYQHLIFIQRCRIYGLWGAGHNQTSIAKEVGVHKSTISCEFKRNIFYRDSCIPQYCPHYAQSYTDNHQNDWSPEQISGYAKRHNLFSISHECIYQFILANKKKGGNLYKYLRHQNKKYRKRYDSPKCCDPIRNCRFIDDHPRKSLGYATPNEVCSST